MIVTSLSPYAAAFAPAPSSPASRPAHAAEARSAVSPAPAAPAQHDDEAALRERYFEEMISNAADLLLRSQMGRTTRFES